ncbi:hypothetical protein ACFE04_020489 [Oxalis oulophora]
MSLKVKENMETKFTWKIDNFMKKSCSYNYFRVSDDFTIEGYKWVLVLFLEKDKLAIGLQGCKEDLQDGWSIDAGFNLSILNQINGENTIQLGLKKVNRYNAKNTSWRYIPTFPTILLSKLNDPDGGYIVNDTLILEVRVFVRNARVVLDQDEVDLSGSSSNNGAVLIQVVHQMINQDTENCCFDKMALSLLEKLQDDNALHSFRIADFKGIPSDNYVDVGIFMVPTSLESYAKELLARQANIGTGNSPVHYVNEVVFAVLCDAVKSMDTTRFGEMNESLILKWRDAIMGALKFGFKVDFLKGRLKSIAEIYLAILEKDSFERKKLQALDEKIYEERKKVQALDKKVSAKRKKLDTLMVERTDMYKKMKIEIRKTCEVAVSKFSGIPNKIQRRLTTKAKAICLEIADGFVSRHPFFLVPLPVSSVCGTRKAKPMLTIPLSFYKKYLKKDKDSVILVNFDGKTWPASYFYSSRSINARLYNGWMEFAEDNHLQFGDTLPWNFTEKLVKRTNVQAVRFWVPGGLHFPKTNSLQV